MQIVAFGHRKYTGKDTAARFLATQYRLCNKGCLVVRAGFADKLKDIAYQLYGWAGVKPREYYDSHPYEKDENNLILGKTIREVWIEVGMKMREIYNDSWVDYLLCSTKADLLIIPDLRFINEVNAIKNKGGKCIKIERPEITDSDDEADLGLADYDGWDDTIINDGSISSFSNKVIGCCSKFLESLEADK